MNGLSTASSAYLLSSLIEVRGVGINIDRHSHAGAGRVVRLWGRQLPNKRKAKKISTLSGESEAFLEEMRAKSSAGSTSAILEDILQSIRRQNRRSSIERELTKYYDSLTEAEVVEEKQWGQLARRGFQAEESS